MKSFEISKSEEGQTLFKFVKKVLPLAPLGFIEKLFRIRDVKVNAVREEKNRILQEGDRVDIYLNDRQWTDFTEEKREVRFFVDPETVYEDENLLIVNKPRGLLVHGDKNEKRITLTNMVLSYLHRKGEFSFDAGGFVPALAHRIDRNTSGLVIFGKNVRALQAMEDIFREHTRIEKTYLALVKGILPAAGTIDKPLLKDEEKALVKVVSEKNGGKPARTQYTLLESFGWCSLAEIQLLTGRTHQIRVHFASVQHPLLGDDKYGDFGLNREFSEKYAFHGQFLHAYRIRLKEIDGFLSYLSGKEFSCPLDEKEQSVLDRLRLERGEER